SPCSLLVHAYIQKFVTQERCGSHPKSVPLKRSCTVRAGREDISSRQFPNEGDAAGTRAKLPVEIKLKTKVLILVQAAGVEPASENVTGQETTCLFTFMPLALPKEVRDRRSERTRNGCR